MARSRIIKPEFFEDPKIGRLSLGARLLYIGLWVQADDAGNVQADPGFLRSRLFPHDDVSLQDISSWLTECSVSTHAVPYEHSGDPYIHLPTFSRHQHINRPSSWRNPPPPTGSDSELHEGSVRTQGVLREGSSSKPKPKPETKTLQTGDTSPEAKPLQYGNPDVNFVLDHLKTTLKLPMLDGAQKANRCYAHLALKKFGGREKVALLIEVAAADSFWATRLTSAEALYKHGVQIVSKTRETVGASGPGSIRGGVYDATNIG